jgi:hypothetical protein
MSAARRPFRALPLAALLLALAACAGAGRAADPLAEVRSARATWAAQELRSYRFDFERQCFCVREAVEPVTVEVREGAVHEVRARATGEVMPGGDAVPWYTIEQLFDQIEEAQAAGTQPVRVEYHRRGHPTEIEIGSLAADAGVRYIVGDPRPLEQAAGPPLPSSSRPTSP